MNSWLCAKEKMIPEVLGPTANSAGEGGVPNLVRVTGQGFIQRNRILPFLLILFAMSATVLMAGAGQWKFIGGPTGGPIRHLVQDSGSPEVLFAIGEPLKGGIWKSSDRGLNWAPWSLRSEDGTVYDFAVDPRDSSTSFKGTGSGIFRSQDDGSSWEKITPVEGVRGVHFIALHPAAPGLVYAYMRRDFQSGIWRSEDAGDSWTPPEEGLGNVSAMAVSPDDPSTLFAGTQLGKIFRSTDAAVSWSPVDLGESGFVRTLAFDPADPSVIYAAFAHGVFRSSDRGDTWTEVGVEDVSFTGVRVASDGTVYALTDTELYRSLDRGAAWSPMQLQQGLTDLISDFEQPGLLFAATSNGVFRQEFGEPWVASNDGLENAPLYSLAVHPNSPEIFFAGGDGAVFRSDDRAETWTRFAFPVDPSSPSSANVRHIVFDPHDSETLYAGSFQGVFRSRDGGVDWETVNSGLENLHVRALLVDPNRPGRLYAAMGEELWAGTFPIGSTGGVFRSDDGGDNWVAGALQGNFVQCLALDSVNDLLLTFRKKSEDGGLTVTDFDNAQHPWPVGGCQSLQFHPTESEALYLTNLNGVFRSEDGGRTWRSLNAGFDNASHFSIQLAFARDDPETLYATTGPGVYQSRNGGRRWFPITGGLPRHPLNCIAADPLDPFSAFSCPRSGGLAHYSSILPGPENLRHAAFSAVLTAGDEFTGVALTNMGLEAADVQLTALGAGGEISPAETDDNPVLIQLAPGQRRAFLAREVFGEGVDDADAARWFRVDSSTPDVIVLQSLGKFDLSALSASALDALGLNEFALTEIVPDGSTVLHFANPNPQAVQVAMTLFSAAGAPRGDAAVFEIPPFGVVRKELEEIAGGADIEDTDFLIGGSAQRIIPISLIRPNSGDFSTVPFLDRSAGAAALLAPHYAVGDSFVTEFFFINVDGNCQIPASVHLRLYRDDGVQMGASNVQIPCRRSAVIRDPGSFGDFGEDGFSGYVAIESSQPIGGTVRYRGEGPFDFLGVSPLVSSFSKEFVVNHLVAFGGDFMGVAIVNPTEEPAEVRMEAFDPSGQLIASSVQALAPGHRASRLLTEHLPELSGAQLLGGYVTISSDREIAASVIYAPSRLTSLMPVPVQPLQDQ